MESLEGYSYYDTPSGSQYIRNVVPEDYHQSVPPRKIGNHKPGELLYNSSESYNICRATQLCNTTNPISHLTFLPNYTLGPPNDFMTSSALDPGYTQSQWSRGQSPQLDAASGHLVRRLPNSSNLPLTLTQCAIDRALDDETYHDVCTTLPDPNSSFGTNQVSPNRPQPYHGYSTGTSKAETAHFRGDTPSLDLVESSTNQPVVNRHPSWSMPLLGGDYMLNQNLFEYGPFYDSSSDTGRPIPINDPELENEISMSTLTAATISARLRPAEDHEISVPQVALAGGYFAPEDDVPVLVQPEVNSAGNIRISRLPPRKLPIIYDIPAIPDMTVSQLKTELKKRNLSAIGKKADLQARLAANTTDL